ncbi:AraC family transcriptional regulator [Spongiibacter sp. KMU-158]|uniref:AraC family transcriptional regulator n=1 Tax=Spongiibacter pelagi TaxID=2760804 RepID=A0A927GVZ0_9GAMM|nr:AraC family transcriptional regulator [Spongiibacter pelagi]MBD2858905.1 AraC family transcriptional regulator [Spongiibacter pelagi]
MDLAPEAKHTIASHFARAHLANAQRQGLNRAALLNRAGLSEAVLAEEQARVAPQQLASLFQGIWQGLDDELLGLCERPLKVGVFALSAESMVRCHTLGEALQAQLRIYQLIDPGFDIRLERTAHHVHLHFQLRQPQRDTHHLLIELLMLVWHRFPAWLVAERIPLEEIQFSYAPPKHREEYALLYPGPSRFFQDSNCLTWPLEVLDWPVRRNVEQLGNYFKLVPLPWFRKQTFNESLSDQVIRLLESAPPETLATVDDIAKQLHITARTLRRKLTLEGNAFHQLKENLRRDRAIYWLSQEDVPIAEVSRRCGYVEPTAFIRAFKSWTKKTPGQYRRRMRS